MKLNADVTGSGPALVLLHGFPLDRTMWDSQVGPLAATHRVVTLDLRGQGKSEAAPGVYGMETMAADVFETLDGLSLTEPVVLAGLSMGGYVALAAVAAKPERIRGLILLDTRAIPDTPEAASNRETSARKLESDGNVGELVDGMIPRLFGATTRATNPALIEATRQSMLGNRPGGLAGALRGMAVRPDRTPLLASITVPTLVVVGAEDQISTPTESESIASAIPGARLVVIPSAGHLTPLENPEATTQAMMTFLAELEQS
ncbi:MAG: alpha/beta fold hydrolase [Isosphaeraceae bacterium]